MTKKTLLRKIFKNINHSPELKFYLPEVYKGILKNSKLKIECIFLKKMNITNT